MRNALGLMLASVVTAVLITGVWFWTSSPRADAAPPQTVVARKAEPLPAPLPRVATIAGHDESVSRLPHSEQRSRCAHCGTDSAGP